MGRKLRYSISFIPQVKEFVRYLPPQIKQRIVASFDEISQNPQAGDPLRDELKGYWKFKVSRYR
ncbi:MAG: type II toxin-antitoxin system RelE/ParE family toxin, partial [Candidatus Omnitrophica bacterium]|nr:type II toxin-antitoxin system RelE/ParE family toxin [Candidatus Omnitrophota bacterium]